MAQAGTDKAIFRDMPNPTQEQLDSPEFKAIWKVIKDWDVNAPKHYEGYCGANGSHVAMILNTLEPVLRNRDIKVAIESIEGHEHY